MTDLNDIAVRYLPKFWTSLLNLESKLDCVKNDRFTRNEAVSQYGLSSFY